MARQMVRSYGNNLKATRPLDLHFTALEQARRYPDLLGEHYTSWDSCKWCESTALQTWPRDELVWLTPDADAPLLELNTNDVYVVGGLIDRTVIKNHTLNLARDAGVRVARLPLKEFAPISNVHPILDVVTVVQMVAEVHSGAPWAEAIEQHMPVRHIRRRERERRTPPQGATRAAQ